MEESANGRRVCRLPVTLHCPASGGFFSGFTRDIGLDGLFVEGASCLSTGIEVNVSVVDSRQVLSVTGHIESSRSKGTEVRFTGLTGKERGTLERLLWPGWDEGTSLLDCFLVVARREPIYNLKDCVRLTTLVESHRHAAAVTTPAHHS
ncbi:MAG: PilZ domain-containing protein [Pseudomonadota bacterium]